MDGTLRRAAQSPTLRLAAASTGHSPTQLRRLTKRKLSAQRVGVEQRSGAAGAGGVKAQPACRLRPQQRAAAHLLLAVLRHLSCNHDRLSLCHVSSSPESKPVGGSSIGNPTLLHTGLHGCGSLGDAQAGRQVSECASEWRHSSDGCLA